MGSGKCALQKETRGRQPLHPVCIQRHCPFGFKIVVSGHLGVYIFIHGHLTPGGGFQGGAIIATGFLLMLLAYENFRVSHHVLSYIESFAGIIFVVIGLLGFMNGGTFLQNFLPTGNRHHEQSVQRRRNWYHLRDGGFQSGCRAYRFDLFCFTRERLMLWMNKCLKFWNMAFTGHPFC
ncbi:MAG: hypothetical protein GXO86_15700 [Chlorobi bacterium]|nr:hypothetical protein [Chlorobiota bacterium]